MGWTHHAMEGFFPTSLGPGRDTTIVVSLKAAASSVGSRALGKVVQMNPA